MTGESRLQALRTQIAEADPGLDRDLLLVELGGVLMAAELRPAFLDALATAIRVSQAAGNCGPETEDDTSIRPSNTQHLPATRSE